jgi:flagellar motility protein MotE (MotC chaperone)
MKRIIMTTQILIIFLIILKIFFLMDGMQPSLLLSALPLHFLSQANAQTSGKSQLAVVRDVTDDGLKVERELMTILQKKKKELDAREVVIKVEEEKLHALKNELIGKIDVLKALDEKLSAKIDAEQASDTKRLKELAKVYEATPPQKAAAMLEKLETSTAAGISINMKRERAGLIWGFLSPQKAVEITREITKKSKNAPE